MYIPRLIHHIWLGPRPFPEEYRAFREGWIRNHPSWKFRLWTDADLPQLSLRNGVLLGRMQTYSERSDVLRFELLHLFGGVYVDADFESLRPLDELIAPYRFFVGRDKLPHMLNTGLMGSTPHHRFLAGVIEALPMNLHLCSTHGLAHPNDTTGPGFFSRAVAQGRPRDLHVFPTTTFYPYAWDELHRRDEDFRSTCPSAHAVHHWSFSWQTRISAVGTTDEHITAERSG